MSGYFPSIQTVVKGAFASAVGFSTLSVGLLYYGQNFMIYPSAFPHTSRTVVPVPTDYDLPYEDLTFDTADHVKIRAYLLAQRIELEDGAPINHRGQGNGYSTDDEFMSTRPTVIMFHGNGGNVGHRIPLARVFFLNMRCNVLMVEYRGYGMSEGMPSETGIRMDAQSALDYILSHPSLSKTLIVLYGQSIGGAVAIDLASRNPSAIRALILENTFLSIPRLIPHAMPWLAPLSFLCHEKWDSASKVKLIPVKTPILMLSGQEDEIVPREHMKELERLLRIVPGFGRRPGDIKEFTTGSHNNTFLQPGYWSIVSHFISDIQKKYRYGDRNGRDVDF